MLRLLWPCSNMLHSFSPTSRSPTPCTPHSAPHVARPATGSQQTRTLTRGPRRTASLAALVTSTEPASSLLLSTALNQLVGSTFSLDTSRPDPALIATYLHDSLFAAIAHEGDGEPEEAKLERKVVLADAIIDVAWQLDQQVDTQVPLMWRRANPPALGDSAVVDVPATDKMEVDAAEPKADNLEAERATQMVAAVEEARKRLAQIIKQLVVRAISGILLSSPLTALSHSNPATYREKPSSSASNCPSSAYSVSYPTPISSSALKSASERPSSTSCPLKAKGRVR